MPTHKFDDIIPPSRRREAEPLSQYTNNTSPRTHGKSPRFPYATIIIAVLVIAASGAALLHFSSARIDIVPSTASAAVQSTLTASQTSGELPFKVITAQKIASQSVKGNGTKTVNASASGTITIYNTQSKVQQLIATTRFATPAGLVFRIREGVKVPAGSVSKPGSLTVKVYADQAGSSYNVGPSSFTLPAFAGKPEATQVYARSTTAMTGGASGTVPVVDSAGGVQARTALTTALAADLEKSIQDQVIAGYVLLDGATETSYQELDSAASETAGMVDVKMQGTITAVIFPNAALAKAIALSVSGLTYQGEPLTLTDTADLKLVPTSGIPDADAASFSFALSGTAPLVYTVDKARIAAAVAGKTRDAVEVALTNYPEVNRAVIVLRPFWKQSFPEDPAAIAISVNTP